jgi:hypothetical protein
MDLTRIILGSGIALAGATCGIALLRYEKKNDGVYTSDETAPLVVHQSPRVPESVKDTSYSDVCIPSTNITYEHTDTGLRIDYHGELGCEGVNFFGFMEAVNQYGKTTVYPRDIMSEDYFNQALESCFMGDEFEKDYDTFKGVVRDFDCQDIEQWECIQTGRDASLYVIINSGQILPTNYVYCTELDYLLPSGYVGLSPTLFK